MPPPTFWVKFTPLIVGLFRYSFREQSGTRPDPDQSGNPDSNLGSLLVKIDAVTDTYCPVLSSYGICICPPQYGAQTG